ncbi:hypothetical protein QFC21_005806 [Naganishia friedmannii]|uniref:Uncharacterized protein n=1 Tax=Naganishia friedmannii TaxID=89922 RepID=A0ACC2V7H6_9TREE|nr:hypothetical protein QFC21_005806 [Naganishia friedmannii]
MSSPSSSSSEDEYDPREALSQIDADLTHLEHILQPLLEGAQGTWNDVLDHLGNMEQAKMGMIVAYGVCDLIWKANKVDIAAAGRFITAAIPRAQRLGALTSTSAAAASEDGETTSSRANTPVPALEEEVREVGKHSRFKIAHDSVPEKLQKGDGEGLEEDEIEVVQGSEEAPVSRRKGKRVAAEDFLDSPPPPPAPAGSGSGSEGTTTKRAKTGVKSAVTATSTSPIVEGAAAGGGNPRRAARKSTNSKRS